MHKEYAPRRKIDMHTISGDSMRARTLQACNVPAPPAPRPPAPGIDLAAIAAGIAAASKQIVKQGSKGDAAKWAQALLNNKLGGPDLAVDGNFGPASVAATRIFQRNVKKFFKLNNSQMKIDGIIGPATWFWLTR
jgi:peptidoglycan hydrolase-like protein with peptidoglycan-binding domain